MSKSKALIAAIEKSLESDDVVLVVWVYDTDDYKVVNDSQYEGDDDFACEVARYFAGEACC